MLSSLPRLLSNTCHQAAGGRRLAPLQPRVALGLFACLALCAATGWGTSDLSFEPVSAADGLTQSTVLALGQDHAGGIWLGTEAGLHRYSPGMSRSVQHENLPLATHAVWAIVTDARGQLWVGSAGGGVSLIPNPEAPKPDVRHFRHESHNPKSLASDYVRALALDGEDALWVGHRERGLDRLDLNSGEVTNYRRNPDDVDSLVDDRVFALVATEDSVWIGTEGGVSRLDKKSGAFRSYRHDPWNVDSLSDDRVRDLMVDKDGTVWVGTLNGLTSIAPATRRVRRLTVGEADHVQSVRAILQDSSGRLWAGGYQGLFMLDDEKDTLSRVAGTRDGESPVDGVEIRALMETSDNTVWVGTNLGGAAFWNPSRSGFGQQSALVTRNDRSRVVTSFAEQGSRLWFGTFGGGLRAMDRDTGEVRALRHRADDPGSLADDRVMALELSRDGELWIGTLKGGLDRLDIESGRIENYVHSPDDSSSLGADGVMSLLEDRFGDLWVGTFGGGLSRFERAHGHFVRYLDDADLPVNLVGARVTALAESLAGDLWVGTDARGLFLLNPVTGEVVQFRHNPEDPTTLAADSVFALHLDEDSGELWVGTRGGGLSRLRSPVGWWSSARFETFSIAQGLPDPVVYGILPDSSGGLWVSTNQGLARFDRQSRTFTSFTPADGLQGEEFNFGAAFRSETGELFFGGLNGFNAFFPDQALRSVGQ